MAAKVGSEPIDFSRDFIAQGKNSRAIVCEMCNSKVLKPGVAQLVEKELELPHMRKKAGCEDPAAGEKLTNFWLVSNMYHFENVGFSKNVGTVKFLVCADCEIGPIGWHDTGDRTKFFVAAERVKYI